MLLGVLYALSLVTLSPGVYLLRPPPFPPDDPVKIVGGCGLIIAGIVGLAAGLVTSVLSRVIEVSEELAYFESDEHILADRISSSLPSFLKLVLRLFGFSQ